MKKKLLIGLFALAIAGGAHAAQCPADMRAIDEAMAKNPELAAEQMEQVKALRAEGEELHNAGKHAESVEALAKAKEILGIK